MKNNNSSKFWRYIIEAIVIFASVYLAVLLESKRSADFERGQLIELLNVTIQELYMDSLKLHDMIEDIDNVGFSADVDLFMEIELTEYAVFKVLSNEHSQIDIDSIFNLYAKGQILRPAVMAWFEPPWQLNALKNESKLFISRTLNNSLSFYDKNRSSIYENFSRSRLIREKIKNNFIEQTIFLPGYEKLENIEKSRIVTSNYFKRQLIDSYRNLSELEVLIPLLLESNSQFRKEMQTEISLQEEKMLFR